MREGTSRRGVSFAGRYNSSMDKARLRELWARRLAGLAAAGELINAARRTADVDELLRRMDRMFIRGPKKHGKAQKAAQVEEQVVLRGWSARRAVVARIVGGHPGHPEMGR